MRVGDCQSQGTDTLTTRQSSSPFPICDVVIRQVDSMSSTPLVVMLSLGGGVTLLQFCCQDTGEGGEGGCCHSLTHSLMHAYIVYTFVHIHIHSFVYLFIHPHTWFCFNIYMWACRRGRFTAPRGEGEGGQSAGALGAADVAVLRSFQLLLLLRHLYVRPYVNTSILLRIVPYSSLLPVSLSLLVHRSHSFTYFSFVFDQ
jgi:hypothetical protein